MDAHPSGSHPTGLAEPGPDDPIPAALSRRGLMAGFGAVVGGGALLAGGLASTAASAAPMTGAGRAAPMGAPPIAEHASAPVEGVTYRFLDLFDFTSEAGGAPRNWSSQGSFTMTNTSTLWASLDLAPGAVVYDIEWYVNNTSPGPTQAMGRVWQAGSAGMLTVLMDQTIPVGATASVPHRSVVPPGTNGPYPHGTRLALGLRTLSTGKVGLVGVRVGFRPGPLSTILLPAPTRIYDSRVDDGQMTKGETRQVSLAAKVPAGAVGAIVNLTVIGTNGRGSIRLGKGGATPTATSLQWSRTGDQVTTSASTNISLARTIALQTYAATGATDVVVDLVGYLV